jgi:PA14 domain.
MIFTTRQEIDDYTTKLQTFFSGAPSPNSTPSVFGIWKMLANSVGWPLLDPFSQTINEITTTSITIKVIVPAAVLIDNSVENNNYWLNVNSGPYSYTYRDNVAGVDVTDTITIDQIMTFSVDNYLLVFNKGNLYAGGIRGPLLVYFQLVPQKISVDYKIGDVVRVENCDIGQKINAVVDGIRKSNTSYTLLVSKFEKENSTDVLSTDGNKGKILTFTPTATASASASASNRLFLNPDITNSSNKKFNCWSLNGCYYLALLPSGNLVANDYRSGATFWSSNSSNSSPDYLEFFVNSSNHLIIQLVNLLDDNTTTVTYATIYDSLVTNLALLVYPLQLTITDDRQIVIVNKDGALLYSLNNSKKIRTSLSSGDTIDVVSSESNKLYSANGWHSLTFSSSGVLSFNDESLSFDSGLVTQLYSGYLNGALANLSNGTIPLTSTSSSTSLDSFASITTSPFSLSIYTFVLSGFFLAPSSGSYTFSLTSAGTNYLWVGDNALPENRTLTNVNGVGTQVQMVSNTYYPFCIIFTKNGSGDNTFSCNIRFPNGNTSNGLGYFFIPHGLAITTPYFWPSIKPIYSCKSTSTTSNATYLKFSVDNKVEFSFDNSQVVPVVRLALYNASNNFAYDILTNETKGTIYSGPFVAPFIFKLTNNRDLQILDSNGKKYWSLDYMLQTTIDGTSANATFNYPFPRIGDVVNVGNSIDDRYDGTDARVTGVSYNDRSITVSFFGDDTTRSNELLSKPSRRDRLITDHDTIYSQDDIFASDLELTQLHSPNGWFSTTLDNNGIFRVVDNRNGRKTMWASDPLHYVNHISGTSTTDRVTGAKTVYTDTSTYRINKLNIDITGVLMIVADVTNTTIATTTTVISPIRTSSTSSSTIVPNHLFPITTDTESLDKTLLISPYSLILNNDGNMAIQNAKKVTIWQTNTSLTHFWKSASASNPVFQVHDMSYSIYPNIVSQNGQYSLALKDNVFGVYNKENVLVSGSEKKIIAQPLFYSGSIANGGIAITGAVDCGTLAANNFEYWAKAYYNVYNNMSDTNLVNKIGWIWNYGGATTNKKASGSQPTFTAVYNNPSTSSISTILYVSTVETSVVKLNNVLLSSITYSSLSLLWGTVYSAPITLIPGANTFTFTCYNSGGRCGLAFWCLPPTITSFDCQLDNSSGQLMLKNIGVKESDGLSITGIIQDYAFYSSTTVEGPYTMTLNDSGSLILVNNQGTSYYSMPTATSSPLLLKDVLYVYPSSLGKLLGGQNLLPPGAYDDFSQYLWSPDGNFFFGIVSDFFTFADDTVDASGNVTDALGNDAYYVGAIFDVRFNKPVYTFPNARILASAMARPYITLSSNGVLTGYNNGVSLWTVGTASTTGCYLLLDDSGTLSICNSSGAVLSSYNDSKNYDNFMLSNSITNSKKTFSRPASGFLRLLTSSNGNYTLTFNSDGSLTINYVDIALNNVDLANDDVKDINVFTIYKTIVNGAQTIVFDSDGFLKVYTSSVTTGTPTRTFGPNSSYSLVPGYYKLVLENSGNLAIYDSQFATTVSDLGNITFNSNPTTSSNTAYYNSEKTRLLNGYTNGAAPVAFQNYRWIWDSDDTTGTVNFYTTYKNTRPAFDAFIYVYCFDGVDIYMNGTKLNATLLKSSISTFSGNTTEINQGLGGVRVTIPGNSVSVFKFAAVNNNNGPTGIIFWCVDITGLTLGINTTVTVYNITNNTLFYSNPDTVYCSDKTVMGIEEFGVQTWSSDTAYSETVVYGDYDVDKTKILIRSLRSNEYTFLIPGQKMFSPNGLYYLLFETDGSLSVYLTSSYSETNLDDPPKKLWSNKKPYTGLNDVARLQYVYNANGSGTFGLYDSKGIAYNNTLDLTGGVLYVFTLDNDWSLRLRGSDGSNRVFSP